MDKKCFYKDGLNFSCQRCSFCCGHSPGYVYLSRSDLDRLCKGTGLSVKDFVKKYCREVQYYEGKTVISLLEKANYDCIFWDKGCTLYEHRPSQCRTYPFWAWIVKDKETWDDVAQECPGMRAANGRHWTYEEIEAARKEYIANIPLTWEEVTALINELDAQHPL